MNVEHVKKAIEIISRDDVRINLDTAMVSSDNDGNLYSNEAC
jgi:hypothetical protein